MQVLGIFRQWIIHASMIPIQFEMLPIYIYFNDVSDITTGDLKIYLSWMQKKTLLNSGSVLVVCHGSQ